MKPYLAWSLAASGDSRKPGVGAFWNLPRFWQATSRPGSRESTAEYLRTIWWAHWARVLPKFMTNVALLVLCVVFNACGPAPVIVNGMEARAMYTGDVSTSVRPMNAYEQGVLALRIDASSCDRATVALAQRAAHMWWPYAAVTTSIVPSARGDGTIWCADEYVDVHDGSIVLFPTVDLTAAAHEIGHALGLAHNVQHPVDALMGAYSEAGELTTYDIAALHEVY